MFVELNGIRVALKCIFLCPRMTEIRYFEIVVQEELAVFVLPMCDDICQVTA